MQLPPLQRGTLIKRYKRFLADVMMPDGSQITAHCPNTGAMTGCVEPGWDVWLSHSDNPKRKLAWTLELVASPRGLICVHSVRANPVVGEALRSGLIPSLAGLAPIQAEVRYGEKSRADFKLGDGASTTFVEVKAVTLYGDDGWGLFPDTISERARRHVEELAKVVYQGQRGVMVFCALHAGIDRVAPAHRIDPGYSRALVEASRAGVEIYALGTEISTGHIRAHTPIPFEHSRS